MKITCLLCDRTFGIDEYDTPQTAYVMCPECHNKAWKSARQSSQKSKNKKAESSAKIRDLKKRLGGTLTAKDIRKMFPNKTESKAQKLRGIRKAVKRKVSS